MGSCCTSGHHEFMDQDSDNEEVSPKSQQNPTKPVQSGGMAMVGVPAEEELPSPWPSHSQRSNLLQEDGGDDVGSKDPEIDDHVATEILPQIHRRKGSDGIDPQTLRRFEQHQQRRAQREIERPVVMIRITIESMEKTYPEFEVSIDQNETVYDLKLKVEERAPDSIDPQRQRLIHRGRLLNRDTRRLRQYNVKDGDNLFLVRSRRKQTVANDPSMWHNGCVYTNDYRDRVLEDPDDDVDEGEEVSVPNEDQDRVQNVKFHEVLVNNWPRVFAVAKMDIGAGKELLGDYGNDFWKNFRLMMKRQQQLQEIKDRIHGEWRLKYDALKRQNEELKAERPRGCRLQYDALKRQNEKLKAENERLKKSME